MPRESLHTEPAASCARTLRAACAAALLLVACGGAGDEPRDTGAPQDPPEARLGDRWSGEETEPAAPPTIPAGAPKVQFLGDSLTAGLHLAADRAWPAVLQRRLAADGLPFHLQNAGVSGDTSAGGRSRVDWLLKQAPDVVVVGLGANDGLRGTPLGPIEANLRATVERLQAAGVAVVLLGQRIPPSYGAEYADGFAAIYPRLAEELGVALVPFLLEGVGGDPELNLPDGIHPNAAGHERVADNVEPALRRVLVALRDGEGG